MWGKIAVGVVIVVLASVWLAALWFLFIYTAQP
jgi:hypothetical protein